MLDLNWDVSIVSDTSALISMCIDMYSIYYRDYYIYII